MNSNFNNFYPVSMDYSEMNYSGINFSNYDNYEKFESTPAPPSTENTEEKNNRSYFGRYIYAGYNAKIGNFSSQGDSWISGIAISYWDVFANDITNTLTVLDGYVAKNIPIILEFADLSNNVQASILYGRSHTIFGHDNQGYNGPNPTGKNVKDVYAYTFDGLTEESVLFKATPRPNFMSEYLVYFYPKYIITGNPVIPPSGRNTYQLVQQNEVQFFNSATQVCIQNDGSFFQATVLPQTYSIAGLGISSGTRVTGIAVAPSKPTGMYPNAIYLTLSSPVDILRSDGNFFLEPPPATPKPTTTPPATTKPGATTGPPTSPPPTTPPFDPMNPLGVAQNTPGPTTAAKPTSPPPTLISSITDAVSSAVSSVVNAVSDVIETVTKAITR